MSAPASADIRSWGNRLDYVIFGIALGAALVLVGWSLQQFGPSMRYRVSSDDVQSGTQLVSRLAWERFCAAAGLVVIIIGAILLVVTFVTLIVSPSDRTATLTVLVTTLLLIIGSAIWTWVYIQRFGLAGIVDQDRQRERAAAFRSSSQQRRHPAGSAMTVYGPPLPDDVTAAQAQQGQGKDPRYATTPNDMRRSSNSAPAPTPPVQRQPQSPQQERPSQHTEHTPINSQTSASPSPRFVLVRDDEPDDTLAPSENRDEAET